MKNLKMRDRKGITLIALVITIIVLLLLAGVSISILSGQDGIIQKAIEAKNRANESAEEEEIRALTLDAQIEYNTNANKDKIEDKIKKYDPSANIINDFANIKGKITGKDYTINLKTGDIYPEKIRPGGIYENGELVYSWNELINDDIIEVSSDGILNRVGKDMYYSWEDEDGTIYEGWDGYDLSKIKGEFVIDSSVKKIGEGVLQGMYFYGSTDLKRIVLQYGIEKIEGDSFNSCPGLEEVILPNTITKIGDNVFSDCPELEKVVLPNTITEIGNYTFSNCSNLKEITFSENIEKIGNKAFENSIWYNNLDSDIVYIGKVLYKYSGTDTKIEIKEGIKAIAGGAFEENTSITSMDIPNGITNIGQRAFYKCSNLTSVKLPNTLIEIGNNAFEWCTSLNNVVIPNSVTKIGEYTFAFNYALTNIEIGTGIEKIPRYFIWDCTSLETLIIPEGITYIGESSIGYCTALNTITFPKSLNKIHSGSWADSFRSTSKLKVINYNGTKAEWNKIDMGSNIDMFKYSHAIVHCIDGDIQL